MKCPELQVRIVMFRLRPHRLLPRGLAVRSYATSGSPHALVFVEHRDGQLDSASLSALTAAQQLGGSITGLVIGAPGEADKIAEKLKKYVVNLSNTLVAEADDHNRGN